MLLVLLMAAMTTTAMAAASIESTQSSSGSRIPTGVGAAVGAAVGTRAAVCLVFLVLLFFIMLAIQHVRTNGTSKEAPYGA